MIRVTGLGVLILGLAGVGALAGTIPPPIQESKATRGNAEGASLVFDVVEHDFGEVTDEGPVEMSFPFTNVGMQSVTINRMHSYCGCTTPELEKKTYAPGEKGEIKVVFDPSRRHGLQIKKIQVYTDDPVNPVKMLVAQGYVRALAYLEPHMVNFGDVVKGGTLSKVVYVMGAKEDFTITGTRSSDPELLGAEIIASAPVDQDGVEMQRWTIRVDLLGAKRSGRYSEQIELLTNDPRRPSLDLNVLLRVPSDLKLGWPMVRVGRLTKGDSIEEEILLRHEGGKPFTIESIESESRNLDLSFEWFAPEKAEDPHRILIRGKAIKGGGAIQDRIIITTDLEDEEPMSVAFRGLVIDPDMQAGKGTPAASVDTGDAVQVEDG